MIPTNQVRNGLVLPPLSKISSYFLLLTSYLYLSILPSLALGAGIKGKPVYGIGCLLPLSGPQQSSGQQILNGLMLALGIFDNPSLPYKIFVWDTQNDLHQATMGVEALEKKGVMVIISLLQDEAVEAVCNKTQVLGIPIVVLSPKPYIPDIGDFVFRDFITPEIQVKNLVNYVFNQLNFSSFAILHPKNSYGEGFSKVFKTTVFGYGGKIIKDIVYSPDTKDFKHQIKTIIESHFDAIFIPDEPLRAALIISQFAFYAKRDLVFLGTDLWYTPQFIKLIKGQFKTAYFAVGFTEKATEPWVIEFVKKFKATYNEPPQYLAAQAYDIGKMLVYLLSQQTCDIQSILMLKNFHGVTGITSFLPNGDVDKKLHIMQIISRHFTVVR